MIINDYCFNNLEDINKAKYIKRTGTPGNYEYFYKEETGKKKGKINFSNRPYPQKGVNYPKYKNVEFFGNEKIAKKFIDIFSQINVELFRVLSLGKWHHIYLQKQDIPKVTNYLSSFGFETKEMEELDTDYRESNTIATGAKTKKIKKVIAIKR